MPQSPSESDFGAYVPVSPIPPHRLKECYGDDGTMASYRPNYYAFTSAKRITNSFSGSMVATPSYSPRNPNSTPTAALDTPRVRHEVIPIMHFGDKQSLVSSSPAAVVSTPMAPLTYHNTNVHKSSPLSPLSAMTQASKETASPMVDSTQSTPSDCHKRPNKRIDGDVEDCQGSDTESELDLKIQAEFDKPNGRVFYDPLSAMYDGESTRVWHVDWMRFIANWLVVSVHFVRTVNEMQLAKSEGQGVTMESFLVNLLQIGMPIFFYASGRASGFSNGRSFWVFLQKKCLRLLVPLLAAYPIVLLPAALISGPFYEGRDATMPESTWQNIGPSILWWLRRFPAGCVEWLWYLPTLAFLGVITYPYCVWMNSWHLLTSPDRLLTQRDLAAKIKLLSKYKIDKDTHDAQSYYRQLLSKPIVQTTAGLTATGVVASLVAAFFNKNYHMYAPLMVAYSLSFLLPPFILMSILSICRRINYRTPIFAVFPLATMVFAFIKEATVADLHAHGLKTNTWLIILSVPYYVAFYLQGHLEQRYMFEWEHYERMAIRSTDGRMTLSFMLRPFKVIFWVALWANGAPGFRDEWGYMWAYPLYTKMYTNVSYVLASWIGLHFWERFMAFYARTNITPSYHKHVINMSLIVYIFHGLHIALVGRTLIWPFRNYINAFAGIMLFVLSVVPATIGTYFGIINVPPLATVFGVGGGFKTWAFSNWFVPTKKVLAWAKSQAVSRGWYHTSTHVNL
eukprot:Blabericola_migrator_1__4312@NODE_2323_length_2939_cov_1013_564067_g1456_i0_p1_GENE_NODE_2323_length_2939_cov_1013_564067_g1456_i0NODE_2323_length_2939_cov_1013_564067_g1456_i0_p1_ORF_typecomplete_len737_score64_17Acyl_transf_3/PF01757_22/1_1e13Acyl_transf_3/PF01757_22/1_4e04_NODE_2323_length_2939_cov_1013_564067_g1456_i02152425